jgi:hypothetical protein
MNPTDSERSSTSNTNDRRGTDNHGYVRNDAVTYLMTLNEEESTDVTFSTPRESTSPSSYHVNYEVPAYHKITTPSEVSHGPPTSFSTNSFSHSQPHRSSALGPNERQLSILDPLSDRVSTVLVWQNLVVEARQSKRKEFFQRMKSYKTFVPQRKALLNSTSGAIAGGLWAVMGKLFFLIYFKYYHFYT